MLDVIAMLSHRVFLASAFSASVLVSIHAHDALPTPQKPLGWSYPQMCCSGVDCRQVSKATISERPQGYVINNTGEVVGYTDRRVKNSPDGIYHWCSVRGANDGRTICLFVPRNEY